VKNQTIASNSSATVARKYNRHKLEILRIIDIFECLFDYNLKLSKFKIYLKIVIHLYLQNSQTTEEVNCIEPSLSVSIPGSDNGRNYVEEMKIVLISAAFCCVKKELFLLEVFVT
jgi:hypothetical protein